MLARLCVSALWKEPISGSHNRAAQRSVRIVASLYIFSFLQPNDLTRCHQSTATRHLFHSHFYQMLKCECAKRSLLIASLVPAITMMGLVQVAVATATYSIQI